MNQIIGKRERRDLKNEKRVEIISKTLLIVMSETILKKGTEKTDNVVIQKKLFTIKSKNLRGLVEM